MILKLITSDVLGHGWSWCDSTSISIRHSPTPNWRSKILPGSPPKIARLVDKTLLSILDYIILYLYHLHSPSISQPSYKPCYFSIGARYYLQLQIRRCLKIVVPWGSNLTCTSLTQGCFTMLKTPLDCSIQHTHTQIPIIPQFRTSKFGKRQLFISFLNLPVSCCT